MGSPAGWSIMGSAAGWSIMGSAAGSGCAGCSAGISASAGCWCTSCLSAGVSNCIVAADSVSFVCFTVSGIHLKSAGITSGKMTASYRMLFHMYGMQ